MNRIAVTAFAALALSTLGGCADYNWDEAESVAKSNTLLNVAAYKSLSSDWEAAKRRATSATLNWTELDNGWEFDGSVTSDESSWSGTMDFDGSLVGDENSADWDLSVTYHSCAYDGVTLDGTMSWHWGVEVFADGFRMVYQVTGNVTSAGEVEGPGSLDYGASIELHGTSLALAVTGDVGGTPVDFSLTINLPF